jgi:hypothetical protein
MRQAFVTCMMMHFYRMRTECLTGAISVHFFPLMSIQYNILEQNAVI